MACCISPLRRSTTLAPHTGHTHTLPQVCRPHNWPFCGSWTSRPERPCHGRECAGILQFGESGRMSRATDWSAKRSTRRTMGFSEVARNFALIPRAPARPSCRAVRGSRSTDPAGAAALGPVVLWEIALLHAEFWRVRDTLCMSVVLSINTSETGLARNGSKRSRGFSFKMPRWVALRFQRVKHDSALVHKGANWNADFLSNQLLNASV